MSSALKMLMTILILALTGCATMFNPSKDEVARADYGRYPTNYREIVKGWIDTTFFDPQSVNYLVISEPVTCWFREAVVRGGKIHWGYRVQVTVNGKNRFGGYVGRRVHYLLIRNSEVIYEWEPEDTL